ncbi:MAG: hypothetical protein LBN22_01590, partial [Clostridiales Family XIII bacterium]|nr:hypothetical protein [Clostridiales Family XIII bacterium]
PIVGTSIESLLSNCSEDFSEIYIHILDYGLTAQNMEKMRQILDAHNTNDLFTIYFYSNFDMKGLDQIEMLSDHTNVIYSRFFIPEILSTIDRCILLGGDTLILKSLKEFWSIDLGDNFIGSAIDYNMGVSSVHKKLIGIHEFSPYINTDVLILNLDILRKNQISKKLTQYALANDGRLPFADQDSWSAVLEDHIYIFSPIYNNLGWQHNPSYTKHISINV